ncbi:TonB-dependent receptor [Namhaeicola litoreus]|uniref:TonB-dependent receptor n=1 Tax=Namhaeicola litoreus TaxID=1052145 RepID=A0ABW3Y2D1_9FLAO
MYRRYFILVFLFVVSHAKAQEKEQDSILPISLEEIILVSQQDIFNQKQAKPLSTVDEFLEKSTRINMIKRGNYAWEPAMNNMLSERLSVTIDGMQIFGACTDKMDPITSYVDVSNLSEIHVNSGQQGLENGATIGGGVDLVLQKSYFGGPKQNFGLDLGYESNPRAKIMSAEYNVSRQKYFINTDFLYRNADNYYAGGGEKVQFSQYQKFNVSLASGMKLTEESALVGTFIYDQANDVGYPALTMDVSLAKAIIASLSYEYKNLDALFYDFESKVYFNTIEHVMDDTNRPDTPIHMDMPGWSDTFGFYAKAKSKKNKHQILTNFNGYYNRSKAEMTMYPNDPEESLMFMLTWPDVQTFYTGLFLEDIWTLNSADQIKFHLRIGGQHENIADDFGFNSLKIFYPNMDRSQERFLFGFNSTYTKVLNHFDWMAGLGHGQRAPSVSEAYGFYLFNSFDNFDYIGNPELGNEKSTEINFKLAYKKQNFGLGLETSFFYIKDYILGVVDPVLSEMTIGADGVKIYSALDYATIWNTSVNADYSFLLNWHLMAKVGYSLGQDMDGENLPLISPVTYQVGFHFKKNMFDAEFILNGAGKQKNFSPEFGENQTEAYAVCNLNGSYNFYLGKNTIFLKTGVENIFDVNYSTYTDWNNIPRMGRNFFINLSYVFQ